MSVDTSILLAGTLAALFLFIFSRRYRLPPGPPGNVAREFTNASMTEVFGKWRQEYGASHGARQSSIHDLVIYE
jgi:hypothetical protein